MTFDEIIKKSEIILIEGSKKVGKLSLALYECAENTTLILSAYQKPIFFKRLSAITNLQNENIQKTLSTLKFLTLKENWLDYKIKYGYDFLIEDIKRAIKENSAKNIIFHRIDLLFGTYVNESATIFMDKLVNLKKELECKFFLTVIPNEENEHIIETIEDFSDMNIEIKKEKERIINVKNSIFPISEDKYFYLYKNNEIQIKPIENNINTTKKTHILLISEDRSLIALHRYVFNEKKFFLDIAQNLSETINKILSGPDIIIYNPKNESLDLSVCNTLKEKKIPSRLIYITQNNYVRSEDKIKALDSGCYDIFPSNFPLIEYILEMEKILNTNFYTQILNKLNTNKIIYSINHFCDITDAFYNEKIYFSIIKFNMDENPEILRQKLRTTDIVYYNKKSKAYIICLINIRKSNINPVLDKLGLDISSVKTYEATQWNEIRQEICK